MSNASEWGRQGYIKSKAKRDLLFQSRKLEYEKKPMLCSYCLHIIPYEDITYKKRYIKNNPNSKIFCGHKCKAIYYNKQNSLR